ncbi:hypothetical protein JGU66_27520 [Myxococcaceae bacterium JPH2]|nr:hypothetical protein [Myxococcaceae bacterium JPH2]
MKTPSIRARLTGFTLMALALMTPAAGLAHGKDGVHVMGTVKEVKQNALVLETSDKKQQEVMTDPSTRYEKSGATATAADLKAGERVVVHGMKMSNDQVHAQLVKFGKPPAKGTGADSGTPGESEPAAAPHAHGSGHEHAGH